MYLKERKLQQKFDLRQNSVFSEHKSYLSMKILHCRQ